MKFNKLFLYNFIFRLQPLIYPGNSYMPNLLQYGNPGGTSISPSTTTGHYPNIYDFGNQYPQSQQQLENSATSASFPYGNSSHASAASHLLASQGSNNPANVNYAYAALAQQAMATGTPQLAASYQQ